MYNVTVLNYARGLRDERVALFKSFSVLIFTQVSHCVSEYIIMQFGRKRKMLSENFSITKHILTSSQTTFRVN